MRTWCQIYETHRKSIGQAIKYTITGEISFVFDYSVFFLVSRVAHYQTATYSGMLIGLLINYILSKRWVFQNNNRANSRELIAFLLVTLLGFILTGLGMYAGVELLYIPKEINKLIVGLLVFFVNFLARKYVIWKEETPER